MYNISATIEIPIVVYATIPIWGSVACVLAVFSMWCFAITLHVILWSMKKLFKYTLALHHNIFLVHVHEPVYLADLCGKPIVLMMMLCNNYTSPIHPELQTNTQVVFHAPDLAA